MRVVSLGVVLLAGAVFLSLTRHGKRQLDFKILLSASLLFVLALLCFLTNKDLFLRSYSVIINATLLVVFSSTLSFAPNMCFRFATMADRKIVGSVYEAKVCNYCKKVTILWCIFFVLNGTVATFTTFWDFGSVQANNRIWSIYNGGISYFLMGMIFVVEGVVRHFVDKAIVKIYPISHFTSTSRDQDHIMCYDGDYTLAIKSGAFKTWGDFLHDTAVLRGYFAKNNTTQYLIHMDDMWVFLCTLVSLLQSRCEVHLTQNTASEFLNNTLSQNPGMEYLCDENISKILDDSALSSQSGKSDPSITDFPSINPDTTKIFLYTSGSTGKAKRVQQRLTEFECDNSFVISKWGGEISNKKLVTTCSPHHIYGFLFGITLPFALGIPFRRKRILYPEEFTSLVGDSYVIIATPAFLKRSVESIKVSEAISYNLNDPFIFSSGGACSPALAKNTKQYFGVCPLEVYGSTETSGIAYRKQDVDGEMFTPFDNAKIWLGEDGCLRVISPYIKDPAGFATSDLAEFSPDGRFLLKGRSDSIVKIEEKRISLTQIEDKIMQTNLVRETKVVAMENEVRQYLAAVIVLNDAGAQKFHDAPKLQINQFFAAYLKNYFENVTIPKKWRFVDSLPRDTQGKVHKEDIVNIILRA